MENKNIPAPAKKKSYWKIKLLLTLIVIFAIVYWVCTFTYSDGSRSGVLIKISYKGYLFKTYEGELNVGGITAGEGTIMPTNIWKFSVRDKSTYDKIDSFQGKKVILHYDEIIYNFPWQGDTKYFVTSVEQE